MTFLMTFFSHRPSFSNFHSFSSQQKLSFHTFAHIRQHYFSKYWGGMNAWAVPPPQTLGGPSPPVPLRSDCACSIIICYIFYMIRNALKLTYSNIEIK